METALFFRMAIISNNAVKAYLNRKTSVMDWPPQSSDLSIIEAV